MAIFPSQTLRDLIQNNIDYVAKQVGVINDFLFGPTSDGTDVIPETPYILHTYQAIYANPEDFGINLSWNQIALASIDIDGSGVTLQCNDSIRCSLGNVPEMAQVDSEVLPYIKNFYFHNSLSEMGIDRIKSSDRYLIGLDGQTEKAVNVSYHYANSDYTNTLFIKPNPPQSLLFEDDTCYILGTVSNFNGGIDHEFYITKLADTNYPANLVVMPSTDSYFTYNYIDNSTQQTINYNGDTIYNYYNDNGDIVINGGGVGGGGGLIAPVGGLAYADVKFILDSLVDELNLNFDFEGDGIPPLNYAPTLDEIRYGDYSDFYIEKLHQYDSLPAAPTFDGSIDFGDIPKVVGESANAYLGLLGVGLSSLLCGCFITAFIVKKMGR